MKKILYVYGYGGSASGSTVTMLKRLMPEGYSVEAFTYTQADCAKAREEIFEYIREHEIDMVIGSSLGGFITHTLQGMPRILVNPCWLPSVELPRIGASAELVATYAPFEQWPEEHAAEESARVHMPIRVQWISIIILSFSLGVLPRKWKIWDTDTECVMV